MRRAESPPPASEYCDILSEANLTCQSISVAQLQADGAAMRQMLEAQQRREMAQQKKALLMSLFRRNLICSTRAE